MILEASRGYDYMFHFCLQAVFEFRQSHSENKVTWSPVCEMASIELIILLAKVGTDLAAEREFNCS